MTPFHLFIIALCAFGLIIALILACRNSEWELGHSETGKQLAIDTLNRDIDKAASEFEAYQERERERLRDERDRLRQLYDEQYKAEKERLRDRQDRERQEITQKLDTAQLEASLQDEGRVEENSQLEGLWYDTLQRLTPYANRRYEENTAIWMRFRRGLNGNNREIIDIGEE